MPAMSEETKAALATLPEAAQKELQGLLEKFGPRAYEPAAEPVEYETGGEIDTAVLVLHGIGGSGAKMEEGKFREGVQMDGFNSKKFFEAGGVKGARIVLPTASKTTAPRLLEFLKAGGVGDGVEPQISWVESFKDFEDPKQGFDWAVPSYDSSAVEYVQSLIRKEISRGIAPNRVFVLCHSQGGSVGWRDVQCPDGGDYGHHMSKAAANMGAKLVANELRGKAMVGILHPGFNKTGMTSKYSHIWEVEGAVDPAVGAKRVLHETNVLTHETSGRFVNCEDGLEIPW